MAIEAGAEAHEERDCRRPAIESASDFLLLLANDPIYGPHSGQRRRETLRVFRKGVSHADMD